MKKKNVSWRRWLAGLLAAVIIAPLTPHAMAAGGDAGTSASAEQTEQSRESDFPYAVSQDYFVCSIDTTDESGNNLSCWVTYKVIPVDSSTE